MQFFLQLLSQIRVYFKLADFFQMGFLIAFLTDQRSSILIGQMFFESYFHWPMVSLLVNGYLDLNGCVYILYYSYGFQMVLL